MSVEDPGQPDARLPSEVKAWGAVSFFSDLGHEAVTSILPALMATMGGPAWLGVIEGVSDASSAIAKLAGGRLADRARNLKALVLVGYLVTGLAMPAIALARTPLVVGLLRAVGWTGRGFRSPIRDTLIVQVTPPGMTGRAFGLERALDQLGAVAAPLCVFFLMQASFGLSTIAALSIVPALLCVATLLVFVPGDAKRVSRPQPAREDSVAPAPAFRRFIVAVAVFGCGDFSKILLVLWAIGGEGAVSPTTLGTGVLLYLAFNAITVFSAYGGGALSDRIGRKRVVVASYVVGACGAAVPVFLDPGWATGVLALGLSGILVGSEEAVERAWAADLAGSRRGRGFGILHATNGLGDLVASVGVGVLWSRFGAEVAFGIAAGVMICGALVAATVETGDD